MLANQHENMIHLNSLTTDMSSLYHNAHGNDWAYHEFTKSLIPVYIPHRKAHVFVIRTDDG